MRNDETYYRAKWEDHSLNRFRDAAADARGSRSERALKSREEDHVCQESDRTRSSERAHSERERENKDRTETTQKAQNTQKKHKALNF